MSLLTAVLRRIPILRSLLVCSRSGRRAASIELQWTIGFAAFSVALLAFVFLLTKPLGDLPAELLDLIGRGELLIYAGALCGTVLYSLRHQLKPVPMALQSRVTPLPALAVYTAVCLFVAGGTYIVRAMAEIHHIATLNQGVVMLLSWTSLIATTILAYVVFSLKHSLGEGAASPQRDGDRDFTRAWIDGGRS